MGGHHSELRKSWIEKLQAYKVIVVDVEVSDCQLVSLWLV